MGACLMGWLQLEVRAFLGVQSNRSAQEMVQLYNLQSRESILCLLVMVWLVLDFLAQLLKAAGFTTNVAYLHGKNAYYRGGTRNYKYSYRFYYPDEYVVKGWGVLPEAASRAGEGPGATGGAFPKGAGSRDAESVSSGVPREVLMEEVKKAVAQVVEGGLHWAVEEMRYLKVCILKRPGQVSFKKIFIAEYLEEIPRASRNMGPKDLQVTMEGGDDSQQPLHLLVQGMRQLQQAYMGRTEGGDFKDVDLPTIPDPGADAAVEYADWLYEVEQSVGSISDKASLWFSGCMAVAHKTYMMYVESTPLQRLSLEPEIPYELKDPKWSRLERRVMTLLLGSLKKAAKEEMVTHRVVSVPNLLYRLHVMYQPGGASERAAILRQLEGMSSGDGVQECISSLRKWRRYLQRAEEMGVSIPDASLLLKGVEAMTNRTLDVHSEVKFRVALAKNELQLQSRPTLDNVIRYHNTILAELQQLGPAKSRASGSGGADNRLKAIGAPGGATQAEATATSPSSLKKTKPCKFFMTDKGCSRGSQCKFEHSFPSREERRARCWECGAKNHSKKECPVIKAKDRTARPTTGGADEPTTRMATASALDATMSPAALASELQAALAASGGMSPTSPPSASSTGAAGSGATVQGETGSTSEVRALLQEANAMLSKMAKLNQMKVTVDKALETLGTTVATMQKEANEREALLDSGASHVLKPVENESLEDCIAVKVELADGQYVTLYQNGGGSLMSGQSTSTSSMILPLGRLVQELGCDLYWSRKKGLRIIHPEFGLLKTYTKGPFPMIIETQALALIAQLEEKKLQVLRENTVEGMKMMVESRMTPSFGWELEGYLQSGQKASALRALLHDDSPLGRQTETHRSLMALEVDVSDKAGWKYLRALPVRRRVRKAMMTKRWAVKIGGDSSHDAYKEVEDNDVIFLDFDVLRSKAFSLRGSSGAYKALMWAALRGQLDGLVGWPAADDEVRNKLQWLWLVANKATELMKTRRPFLMLGCQASKALPRAPEQVRFEEELGVPLSEVTNALHQDAYYVVTNMLLKGQRAARTTEGELLPERYPTTWSSAMHQNIVQAIKQWKEAPNTLEVARMLHKLDGPIHDMSEAEIRKWKRHIRNGHLPYEKRCRTCVRSSATGRAHRRVVAPSCYVVNIDVCGPFRQKGEYQEAKGYRYALVAGYVMPKIEGYKDYPIAEDEAGDARDEDDRREHGPAMGGILDQDDLLEEREEVEEPIEEEVEKELQRDNAKFEELYKEIGDTMEYQVLHFAVPLKSRRTAVVNDAIKTLYLQLRAEGLPVVRLHSDRARELQNRRLRSWLVHHDILATTGESQHPRSNGRAESVVKALKRRTKALMFSAPDLPMTCWPYAMTYAAGQQRALALGRKGPPAKFGEVVEVRKKFWYERRVDLEPKWTDGRYMGPSPDLRQGHLVRFDDGRFTTTTHFKAGVVVPEEVVKEAERGRDPLPKPRRLRSKSSPPEPYRLEKDSIDGDPTRGIAYDPVPKRRLRAKSSPPEPGIFILDASARDGRLVQQSASARDGRRTSWEDLSTKERVQIVSNMKLMKPLKDCERRAEDLAAAFIEKGQYGLEEVKQLFSELELSGQAFSKAAGRQQEEYVTSWSTGVYGHGGISSLRQGVQRLPNTTRFLARVASETLKIPWFGTIMLAKNVVMQCHRDGHNNPDVFNAICAVTEFTGGGVWVQDDSLQEEQAVIKEDYDILVNMGFKIPLERRIWSWWQMGGAEQGLKEELDAFVNGKDADMLEESLVRLDEDHQQLLEDLRDRSELLRFVLEEETMILDETRAAQEDIQAQVEKTQGLISSLLGDTKAKEVKAQTIACKACLKAAAVEEEIDFEALLNDLDGSDLQVVHTVPMKQVRNHLSKWRKAIDKELSNLMEGTLKPMSLTEAKRLEKEGKLCLVPSKGVATLKPPTTRGDGFRRRRSKRRSLPGRAHYGFGKEVERRYAVIPPRFMVEAGLVEDAHSILIAILVLYVDDIFYVSEEVVIQTLHNWVVEKWPCSPLEWAHEGKGTRYLGCEVVQRGYQFILSQSGYIADLLRSYNKDDLLPTLLPSPREWIVDPIDDTPEDFSQEELRQGQKHVGELLWLCLRTRPDLQFIVSHMAQWVSKQPVRISKIGERVLGYLSRTQQMKLTLGYNHEDEAQATDTQTAAAEAPAHNLVSRVLDPRLVELTGYSDASFAPTGGRSYGAVVITMGPSPVAWRASRQPFVTLSVMEAELLEISEASVLMESVGSLVDELAGKRVKRTLKCDNTAATALANGGPGSWRTRHLRVRSAHLIEKIGRGDMSLVHVEGQNQLADLGTKMHPKVRLWQLLRLWGFEDLPPEAMIGLVARICFFAGMVAMIENLPGAAGMDEDQPVDKTPISRAGVDELLLVCGVVSIVAIALWEAAKWLVRSILGAPAALRNLFYSFAIADRRCYYAYLVRGGRTTTPVATWNDENDEAAQAARVAYDMLMLFRVEELKAGLREEGLHLTGLKEDLSRQMKYVLWLWRKDRLSAWLHTWKSR
ncbi:Copia protein [Symbiodinium microadriaticum]|uniref:Copia protein n=1 Tax=Symbiodinium microadriaticum TaxID=2951 RepID=A0A1Q9CE97_SYMMI|nr:Copia protein [Symbiodinium microadriaticum]CAE7947072.1 RE1 [Symbiodinium sp. KB8]